MDKDKVMLIDNGTKIASFISRCLTRNGFDVITIPDLKGSIFKVQAGDADIIIINSTDTGQSTYDVCKRIRSIQETDSIPILLMGDSESTTSVKRAMEVGADDFIVRDATEISLISKIRSLLRIKHLRKQMKEQFAEIQKTNEMLNQQLEMAKQVQQSLIREVNSNTNNIRIISKYMPALEIGGDFYNITELGDGKIVIVIGDVSGHGISAALLTAMLSMMIKTHIDKYKNPSQFLFHINNAFIDTFGEQSNNHMYAGMFYAMIDTRTKRIYYSNAGQPFPVFVNSDANKVYELEASGTPIGMMKDSRYEYKIALYDADDLLLIYTDGLSDNLYKKLQEAFQHTLKISLYEMNANTGYSAENIMEALIGNFTAKNATETERLSLDDVSMILCKM